jgi:hypothetical protein
MTNEPDGGEVRALFEELHAHDRDHRPEFRAMWGRAESRARAAARTRTRASLWSVAAACVVLAAIFALRETRDRDSVRLVADSTLHGVRPALTITRWRSPTAGLLRASGRELLAPPPILSSVLDGVTSTSPQRKGD